MQPKKQKQNKQTNKKRLWHGCTTLWIYYTIELYTLNGWLAWCVNYISIKLLKGRRDFLVVQQLRLCTPSVGPRLNAWLVQFSRSVFATPWTAACQVSLSISNSEFTQTHVHWVGDAIQPSHPLSSPSPPAFSLSQHQGLFQWVSSSHQVAKVLGFQLQHQSFQWIPRTDLLYRMDLLDLLAVQGTLKSHLQHHSSKHRFFSVQLSL